MEKSHISVANVIKYLKKNSNLLRQLRTHTGEKPYQCSQCDQIFSTQSDLKTHLRTHGGGNPYQCNQCDKTFLTQSRLKIHLMTHTWEKAISM